MKTCGTCQHFIGAGDWDLCCNIGERRLCYKTDEACEKHEENPIKHRYYIVMDGEVVCTLNDVIGIHPVYAISLMREDLSERMEKAEKETWPEALSEAKKEVKFE